MATRPVDPKIWQDLLPSISAANAHYGFYQPDMLDELVTAVFITWHYGPRIYEMRKRFPDLHALMLTKKGKDSLIKNLDQFHVAVSHHWFFHSQKSWLEELLLNNSEQKDWPVRLFPFPSCAASSLHSSSEWTLFEAAGFEPKNCTNFACMCGFLPKV